MKTKLFTLIVTVCLVVQLRAEPPNYTDTDYGPLPANFEALVTKYVTDRMKDPSSGTIKIGATPYKTPYPERDGTNPVKYHAAWAVPVTVNAKNDGGKPVDYFFVVYLHGDQVISWTPPE